MSKDKVWEKKQFIDGAFGASIVASVERSESKTDNGSRRRYVDANLRVTDGSGTVSLCDDIDAAEQILTFLSAYVREIKAANAWRENA